MDEKTLLVCCYCHEEAGGAHKCYKCNNIVHLICGEQLNEDEEGFGQNVVCFNCKKDISLVKKASKKNIEKNESKNWLNLKRRSKNEQVGPVKKKEKTLNQEEFTCLKCDAKLTRGSDFYKIRHWRQKHQGEDERESLKFIVPTSHEFALKRNMEKRLKDKNQPKPHKIDLKQDKIEQDQLEALVDEDNIEKGGDEVFTHTRANTVQKSLNSFFAPPPKIENENENEKRDSKLEKIQTDIQGIKVMLETLTLSEQQKQPIYYEDKEVVTNLSENLRQTKNLLELSLPDINVEVLDDGCQIACLTCQDYEKTLPKRLNSASNTWSQGIVYDKNKTEALIAGGSQVWYSFKNSLAEHVGCSSIRNGGQQHFKAKQHKIKTEKKIQHMTSINRNIVSAGVEICKMKSAGVSFENMIGLLAFCGVEVGNVGHGRNLFREVINVAYQYILLKTRKYLQRPMKSTSLCPHIGLAVDKSTPKRDTNQAIVLIMPIDGKRIAVPFDAPLVYEIEENGNIEGGSGKDLASQIIKTLKTRLHVESDNLKYIRAVHADGQYQASTFQNALFEEIGVHQRDPFFLLPWDASHWVERVIDKVNEKSNSSAFMKRITKRCNKLYSIFGYGKGHLEYKGLSKHQNTKALEPKTYATTRFFTSSYDQWKSVYVSYRSLIEAYQKFRETDDDCEETKYEIRGQDFVIDLCGVLDIYASVSCFMVKLQAVNLPSWKVYFWFPKLIQCLKNTRDHLQKLIAGDTLEANVLPHLTKHWQELTEENDGQGQFQEIELTEGWIVTDESSSNENGKKKKTITWQARSPTESLEDMIDLTEILIEELEAKFEMAVEKEAINLGKIFDVEENFKILSKVSIENDQVKFSRELKICWETKGAKEFENFFYHVCDLPHVKSLQDEESDLTLLPHHHSIVLNRFHKTIQKMLWENLGNCQDKLFVDYTTGCSLAPTWINNKLVEIVEINEPDSFYSVFLLKFQSDEIVKARVDEETVNAQFYVNEAVYMYAGKEVCIALDIALATSGSEAIVEGFYSLMKTHKKHGAQSNDTLVERSVVDWCLPHPFSCPKTMDEIASLYTNGDLALGLKKHRSQLFFDSRQRAGKKYKRGKVLDRLENEKPRCPHVVFGDFGQD